MNTLKWKDPRRLERARRRSLPMPVRVWKSMRLYLLVGLVLLTIVTLSDFGIDFVKDRPIRVAVSLAVGAVMYAAIFAWLDTRPSRVELWPKFLIRSLGSRVQQWPYKDLSWYCLSARQHKEQIISILTFGFPSRKNIEIEVPDTMEFETIRGHLEGKVVEQSCA